MTRFLSRCCVAGLSTASVLATYLIAAPTASADVFDPATTGIETFTDVYPGFTDSAECTFEGEESSDAGELVENGPRVTSVARISGTLSGPLQGDPGSAISAELTTTALVTSTDDGPRRISVRGTGSLETGPAFDACNGYVSADNNLGSQFSVEVPTLVTVRADVVGIDGHVDIQGLEDEPGEDGEREEVGSPVILDLQYLASRSNVQVELSPGWWDLEIEADIDSDESVTTEGALNVNAYFGQPGERQRLRGAGRRFLTMPEQRDCAAGTVAPRITADAADAAAVRRVELSVDGRKVAATRRPTAGQPFALALRRGAPATVRALLVLDPATQGAPTRQRTVTATYQGCAR